MESTLQAMGNTVGNTFAYFAFILQIISKFFFQKVENIFFFSKYDIGIFRLYRAKKTKTDSAYNFALSSL